jgi:hypothetical protein
MRADSLGTRSAGRRLNWGDVDVSQQVGWRAPEGAAGVTFSVTLSSGQEYRQASITVAGSGAGAGGDAHGMEMGHSHSHLHGSSSSSSSDSSVPFMQALHVGVMQVDSVHSHAEGHEGHGHGGSWAGHMLPAVFFLLWGAWWAVHSAARVAGAGARRAAYVPRAWYPLTVPGGGRLLRLLEPALKVVLPGVGMFAELYFHPPRPVYNALHNPDGTFSAQHLSFWQHSSMYVFFLLSGCVDLLAARTLPPRAGHLALAAAFLAEAFLFAFHLQGTAGVTDGLHLLLVFSVLGCAASTALEGLWASPNAALARAYFTLLQGGWFAQTAHALYGRKAWPQDMTTQMALPVVYCMHLVAWAVVLLALNAGYVRAVHGDVLLRHGALWATEDDPEADADDFFAIVLGQHHASATLGVRHAHKLRVSDGADGLHAAPARA